MRFTGIAPLVPGSNIDVEIPGVGSIDLRNDFELVETSVRLTSSESLLSLGFRGFSGQSHLLLSFLDIELLEAEYERLDSVSTEDRTLLVDLMFWQNENGAGFAVETAMAHLVFRASELRADCPGPVA